MDNCRYPTEDELHRIRTWDVIPDGERERCLDWIGETCWHFGERGWKKDEHKVYRVSTGGWSGNEDVIYAMKQNVLLWSLSFYNHRRGGHFILLGDPRHEMEP